MKDPEPSESQARALLKMKHDEINLYDISCRGEILWEPHEKVVRTLLDNCTRYCVAQAILNGIATRVEDLLTRDVYPDLDFVNMDDTIIEDRDWYQYHGKLTRYKRFRKNVVMVIYGVKNANNYCHTATIDFSYDKKIDEFSTRRFYSIRSLLNIDKDGIVLFQVPIIIKKDDEMVINFIPKHYANRNHSDRLSLLGVITGKEEDLY